MTINCYRNLIHFFVAHLLLFFFQSHLSREKEELEAEKRDLVRTSERQSQEVEHLNGIAKKILTKYFTSFC